MSNHHRYAMTNHANMARKNLQLFPISRSKEPKPFSVPSSTASACVSARIETPGIGQRGKLAMFHPVGRHLRGISWDLTKVRQLEKETGYLQQLKQELLPKIFKQLQATPKCIHKKVYPQKKTWVSPQSLAKCFQTRSSAGCFPNHFSPDFPGVSSWSWHPMPSRAEAPLYCRWTWTEGSAGRNQCWVLCPLL